MILASASPRRIELMRWLGVQFQAVRAGVDEPSLHSQLQGLSPAEVSRHLAQAKVQAIQGIEPEGLILGADTVVALDGQVLGKPSGRAEAFCMLRQLRGRAHEVITAVAVRRGIVVHSGTVLTRVTMRPVPDEDLQGYITTGEPMDKAGAYAVQGIGRSLVERVEGCYLNVVGLPLCLTSLLLRDAGAPQLADPTDLCRRCARDLYLDPDQNAMVSPHP